MPPKIQWAKDNIFLPMVSPVKYLAYRIRGKKETNDDSLPSNTSETTITEKEMIQEEDSSSQQQETS